MDYTKIAGNLLHWELFILAIIGIVSYYYKGVIGEVIKTKALNKKKKEIINLVQHDLFSTTAQVKNEITRLSFITHGEEDTVKTDLLHHLIALKISTIEEVMKTFLAKEELNTCTAQGLKFAVKNNLSKIVEIYTSQAEKDFIRSGITPSDARFTINAYEDYRKEVTDGFLQRVESITTNDDYYSNYDKMSAILEVIAISLYIIPKDAKSAFEFINGRFKKYNNIKICTTI